MVDKHLFSQAWALVGGNDEIVSHFYELVPDMAIDFPFELDSFQKEVQYDCVKHVYTYLS